MALLTSPRARPGAHSDPEREQALLRLLMIGFVFALIALVGSRTDVKIFVGALLAVALGIFVATYAWPGPTAWRRLVGMMFDVGATTWYLWLSDAAGVMMIGVYLYVCVGNLFRYGRGYAALCQVLCIAGFVAALIAVPYWQAHRVEGIGLLITLIVVPLYVSHLRELVQLSHAKTELALKECLERTRSAS